MYHYLHKSKNINPVYIKIINYKKIEKKKNIQKTIFIISIIFFY